MTNDVTLDGRPLAEELNDRKNNDIKQFVDAEQRELAKNIGLRRPASSRQTCGLRRGRRKAAYCPITKARIAQLLVDESLTLKDIAALMNKTISEIKFYHRLIGLPRKQGRKQATVATPLLPTEPRPDSDGLECPADPATVPGEEK
jgi:hypothetical protein